MQLSSPEEIIDDIRAGKMVVLMDDEDRENEGDLIMAASCVTPEAINFMTKYGRGLICLTLSEQRCRQLKLPLMVQNNGASYGTNFTVSIEAAQGVTTGISASDRATTVLAAVAPNAQPEDIVQPGHIFPIMAQSGGVLNRAGHTEAGCDLARLAGFEPAGVIVEILNDDGTMARRSDLETFAQTHNLKLGTIADLIEYRSLNERSIEKVADCQWPSRYGEFQLHAYQDTIDGLVHYGLSMGNITHDDPTLVRVHVADTLTDLLGGQREGKLSWQLDHALQRIAKEGHGVVLVVTKKECPRDIIERLTRMEGIDKGNIPARKQHNQAVRTIGIGSQILADIGVGKMRLLSAPKRYNALSGFKLEVIEYIEE